MHRLITLVAIASCNRHDPVAAPPPPPRAFYARMLQDRPDVAALTALGKRAFGDPSLSAAGDLACATCHDPANAFSPSGGDPALARGGLRATPSLRYLQSVPRFTEHYHDSDSDNGIDQGPAGGFTWDGRAATAHDQARLPLFSPTEMANRTPAELAARIRASAYAGDYRRAFHREVLARDGDAVDALVLALEIYQQSPAELAPFSSKYDAYLRGTATLSPAETRGLALFEDDKKGNCASCHPSRNKDGGFPLFTDFGYVAIGVPRSANDRGLCGPLRTDLADRPEACGLFRTPSLRNATRRHRFFHNGALATITDVVRFYATRDVTPQRWYRGEPVPRTNVNREPPFGRSTPALSDPEIADIVAFLGTLADAD